VDDRFDEIPGYIPGSRELAGAQVLDGFVAAEQVEKGGNADPARFRDAAAVEDQVGAVMGDRDLLLLSGGLCAEGVRAAHCNPSIAR
jgi:hypothetical protein